MADRRAGLVPNVKVNDRLANLRRRITTPRNLALIVAVAIGVWHVLGGMLLTWVPAQPLPQDFAFDCQYTIGMTPEGCAAIAATYSGHPFFEVYPWFAQYLTEGVVLAVVTFVAYAALRVAWNSFNSEEDRSKAMLSEGASAIAAPSGPSPAPEVAGRAEPSRMVVGRDPVSYETTGSNTIPGAPVPGWPGLTPVPLPVAPRISRKRRLGAGILGGVVADITMVAVLIWGAAYSDTGPYAFFIGLIAGTAVTGLTAGARSRPEWLSALVYTFFLRLLVGLVIIIPVIFLGGQVSRIK